MNATVQCFRHMPELRGALTPVRSSSVGTAFTGVLRDTFKTLDSAGASIFPVQLVGNLRTNFPQFAQTAQNGAFMQQDAEEFFNVLQQSFVEGLASLTSGVNPEYNQLLGINMEEQQTCQETDLEAVVNKTERANRVVCNIQKAQAAGSDLNSSLSAVDHLHDGVKLGNEVFLCHSHCIVLHYIKLVHACISHEHSQSFQSRNSIISFVGDTQDTAVYLIFQSFWW